VARSIVKPPAQADIEATCNTAFGEMTTILKQLSEQRYRLSKIDVSTDYESFVNESHLLSNMYSSARTIAYKVEKVDLFYRNAKAEISGKCIGLRELDLSKLSRVIADYSLEIQGESVNDNFKGHEICWAPRWEEWCAPESPVLGSGVEKTFISMLALPGMLGVSAAAVSDSVFVGLVVAAVLAFGWYLVMKSAAVKETIQEQKKFLLNFPFV
jgi:hypothetical protein